MYGTVEEEASHENEVTGSNPAGHRAHEFYAKKMFDLRLLTHDNTLAHGFAFAI